jgi:hypothetical protein
MKKSSSVPVKPEVPTSPERRRRRAPAEKLAMVEETYDCRKFKHTSLSIPQLLSAKFSRHKPLAARILPCKTDQYLNHSPTFLAFSFPTPHFDDTSPSRAFSWRHLQHIHA